MAYDCTIMISFPADDKATLDGIVAQLTFLPAGSLVNTGVSESENLQVPADGEPPAPPASE